MLLRFRPAATAVETIVTNRDYNCVPMVSRPTVPTPITRPSAPDPKLQSDPRWALIQRILLTGPFQKSANLHSLLRYLAEHSIRNDFTYLTERQIGIAVFGKPDNYSPAEDSAVRVHVRQLRLRLHEYFALEGRGEELRVDIPKGSYVLEFHPAQADEKRVAEAAPALEPTEPKRAGRRIQARDVLLLIASAAAVFLAIGWYRAAHRPAAETPVPWPLNAVIQPNQDTHVVVADSNFMLRLLSDHEITLEEYLQPGFRTNLIPKHTSPGITRLLNYITDSQLTSFADLTVTSMLERMAGPSAHLLLTSSRGFNDRDLQYGNYVFIGSPSSNPWVFLFTDKLNFEVVEDSVGGRMYFRNKKPLDGEQATYDGLLHTGGAGEDYGTISLLPTSNGRGQVLILQGLRQEGTEALGELLASPANRAQLKNALGISDDPRTPVYFEALVRARAVAGAPVSISIVATRKISLNDGAR